MKNKPKRGNLIEKQAQHAFGKKIQKKFEGKLHGKTGRHIRKNAQIAFSSKLKQKQCHKILKKVIHKTEICMKQAQKTSKFQLKHAHKKQPASFQKKQPRNSRENRKAGNTDCHQRV